MHEHWLFVGNALSHWVASMSSIVSFTLGIVELIRNKKIESWIFFAIAGLFLIVGFDQAWQDEHRNAELLKAEKSSAISEREFWKEQSDNKDSAIRQRDNLLAQNYSALIGQQQTSNKAQQSLSQLSGKILDISKPEKLKLTLVGEPLPHYSDNDPKELLILAFTNRMVTPIRALVECDKDIKAARVHLIAAGVTTGKMDYPIEEGKRFYIDISSPAWTPTNPMVMYVTYQNSGPSNCKIMQQ